MYKVFLDTVNAEETLTRMQIQIRDVGHEIIPEQLMTWQREDMKRQYPFATLPNYVSAETSIWPRSRTYERTHKKRMTREALFKRSKSLSAMPRLKGIPGAHRPILRPALFTKLVERMSEMLAVNLKWVTSHTGGSQPPTSGPDANVAARRAMLDPSNYRY
jgi:hypothetical protein